MRALGPRPTVRTIPTPPTRPILIERSKPVALYQPTAHYITGPPYTSFQSVWIQQREGLCQGTHTPREAHGLVSPVVGSMPRKRFLSAEVFETSSVHSVPSSDAKSTLKPSRRSTARYVAVTIFAVHLTPNALRKASSFAV